LSSWLLAGKSPAGGWAKSPQFILRDFIASHWNNTEAGAVLNTSDPTVSEVAWDQWYSGQRDLTIKFVYNTTVVSGEGFVMLTKDVQEQDTIMDIHIMARTYADTDTDGVDNMVWRVENMIQGIIKKYWYEELKTQHGVLKCWVRNVASRPMPQETSESYNEYLKRRVMTVVFRVWQVVA
jgi:hypothetical protein